jgi:hypothetical protein
MAAKYCATCGQLLPVGATGCTSCGTPAAPVSPTLDLAGPVLASPSSGGPPLESILGLGGHRYCLLQHELATLGHTYRVMDREKNHLFTIHEGARREEGRHFEVAGEGSQPGFHRMTVSPGESSAQWAVVDSGSNVRGSISVQIRGNHAMSSLTDEAGNAVVFVDIEKSGFDKLTAHALYPDGRPMFEGRGTMFGHNFSIHAPTGEELAKTHEAWGSVHDTYVLEILGQVDHLSPLVFAILIDSEKELSQRSAAHHPDQERGRIGFEVR